MRPRIHVFGPAYVDRVLRVDGPLGRMPTDPPFDQSVDGSLGFTSGTSLEVVNRAGDVLEISPPAAWPGPWGRIEIGLDRRLGGEAACVCRLHGIDSRETLGGMGAGFAAALRGELVHAVGSEDDPTSQVIQGMLDREGIENQAIRIAGQPADWTLLITSGEHGDKLAIGFRGCHAALTAHDLAPTLARPCDVRVVAGLPNELAASALQAQGAGWRVFAPGIRNMADRSHPVAWFARSVDVLCCNRQEWETLDGREDVAWKVSILVITDGPAGVRARFTSPEGEPGHLTLPSQHRGLPRDTNRAGEALASTLVSTLLAAGWDAGTGVVPADLLRRALLRGSAAAALVLDHTEFGFPGDAEIDQAVRAAGSD